MTQLDSSHPAPMTVGGWLKSCSLPRLEARMLLQAATGLSRSQLITQDDRQLKTVEQAQLDAWAQARLQGQPMAYLLGEREFYGRPFHVSPSVLIPRPETEHLVEAAMAKIQAAATETPKVWDLGTGSGIVAITLALECPQAQVWASDVSVEALAVAQTNAEQLSASVCFKAGSWFDAFVGEIPPFSLDVVVSNPPYIEPDDAHLALGDVRFEPKNALTDHIDGLSALTILAKGAPAFLKTGGWLLLEHGYDQGPAVRALLKRIGYRQVATETDLAGLDRLSMGQWPGIVSF